MSDAGRAAGPPDATEEAERDAAPADASVGLLIASLGRVLRYGGELVALEARAAGHTSLLVARLLVAAWLCVLTGWLALNAGLVWLAFTRLAIDAGYVMLLAAGLNALLAGLLVLLVRRRVRELGRSPLRAFLDRHL